MSVRSGDIPNRGYRRRTGTPAASGVVLGIVRLPSAMIGGVSRWFRSYGFADVLDDLLVGAYPLDQDDVDALARLGVRRVLNLTEDAEYRPGRPRGGASGR